ncbi:substrate-binding domain-containing protein [Mesorhizobium shangrilense]|uniref:Substrate-binding domain-containing protein n=1 Tax=Mesorhizobium shangrilense TaxID=460060 RepID=A0ABV2DGN5_9HYPH
MFQYLMSLRRILSPRVTSLALLAALSLTGSWGQAEAKTADGKYLIYYSMSYLGNTWQTEAMNAIIALSKMPGFADKVELRVQASGADAQRQIQQITSMISAGADGIIAYPISPTALNGVIKRACDRGIVVAVINGVTEPCAYTLKADGVKLGKIRTQFIIDALGGKGNIIEFLGVPGVSYNEDHHRGLVDALADHPEMKVTAQLVGMWSAQETRLKMREFLATHSWEDVNGIVAQLGCDTLTEMQVEDGWYPKNPIIPCSGEAENGARIQMLPKESGIEGALGARGLSVGSGLSGVPYALKIVKDVLDGKKHPRTITYDPVQVITANVKLCQTGSAQEFGQGCNTLPPALVPNDYVIDFWTPETAEIGIQQALTGNP